MAKTKTQIPEDKSILYDKLIQTNPDIERKGVTMPYTSVNGHMFTYLSKDGIMGLRLPEDEREAFLEKHKTTLFKQHGIIMKEYVTVPDRLLKNTKTLQKYLDIGYNYVKGLKPKPTKRKQKKS